jgi:hypothetical protein
VSAGAPQACRAPYRGAPWMGRARWPPRRCLRIALERGAAQTPEEHAAFGAHEGEAVGRGLNACADVAGGLAQRARHDIGTSEPTSGRSARLGTFDVEAVGKPVGLARDVVIDLLKSERFEPARGSWAHVSERVPAVDDHRAPGIELLGRVAVELLEREMDGAGQVHLLVLLAREQPRRAAHGWRAGALVRQARYRSACATS